MREKESVEEKTASEIYEATQMSEDAIFSIVEEALSQRDKARFREEFFENHRYDQARIYLRLNASERAVLHDFLEPQELAEVYDILDEEEQNLIFNFLYDMTPKYAATVLGYMYPDNAADILNEIEPSQMRLYMRLMPKQQADDLKVLMNYEDNTAGAIMTTEFVAIRANQTVKSAMTLLRSKAASAETIYYMYVTDSDSRLVGVLTLRDLIISDGDVMISNLMSERVVTVDVNDNQADVAKTISDYDFLAIPVIEETGELLGIITVDDIIDVMNEEAVSDYSGLAAVDVDEPSHSPVIAAKSRLPWLLTLLFLGMGTSTLISRFENMISEVAVLSLFITLVTGTAGNAGTQSLAVAVRRLAFDDDKTSGIVSLIIREVVTGLISGLVTGIAIFIIVAIWQHNLALGSVVGGAMLCAITVANLAGSLIPMVMDRLGFDPAVASGPFITTLSDLTSVLIYFSIASQFLSFLH